MDLSPEHLPRRRLVLFLLAATISLALPSLLPVSWGVLFAMVAPVPISLAYLLAGGGSALLVTALSGSVMVAVSGPKPAAFMLVEIGVAGLAVGFCLRRRLPLLQVTILSAGVVLAGYLTAVMLTAPGSLQGSADAVRREIDRSGEMMSGYLGKEGPGQATVNPDLFREVMAVFLPGMFVIGALLNSLFCALVSARLAAHLGGGVFPPFADWKLPDQLVWLYIAVGFAMVWDYRVLSGIPAAALLVMSFFYVLQGAAIALTLAARKAMAPWLKFVIAVVVLLQPFFLAVFLILGLLDFRFDFRKPKAAKPA